MQVNIQTFNGSYSAYIMVRLELPAIWLYIWLIFYGTPSPESPKTKLCPLEGVSVNIPILWIVYRVLVLGRHQPDQHYQWIFNDGSKPLEKIKFHGIFVRFSENGTFIGKKYIYIYIPFFCRIMLRLGKWLKHDPKFDLRLFSGCDWDPFSCWRCYEA